MGVFAHGGASVLQSLSTGVLKAPWIAAKNASGKCFRLPLTWMLTWPINPIFESGWVSGGRIASCPRDGERGAHSGLKVE